MNTKENKRVEAKARQEACDKLSPQQRLEKLDEMLGVGKGATKERLKLHAKINQVATVEKAKIEKTAKEVADETALKASRRAKNERREAKDKGEQS